MHVALAEGDSRGMHVALAQGDSRGMHVALAQALAGSVRDRHGRTNRHWHWLSASLQHPRPLCCVCDPASEP